MENKNRYLDDVYLDGVELKSLERDAEKARKDPNYRRNRIAKGILSGAVSGGLTGAIGGLTYNSFKGVSNSSNKKPLIIGGIGGAVAGGALGGIGNHLRNKDIKSYLDGARPRKLSKKEMEERDEILRSTPQHQIMLDELEEYDKDPEKYKRKKILKSTLGMGAMMAGSYGLTDYFLNKALGRGQSKKEIALAAGIGGLGGAATGYLAAKSSNKNVEDYSKDPQFAYRKSLYGKEK